MLTLSLLWNKLKLNIDDIIRPKTYKSALTGFIVSLTLLVGFLIYIELNISIASISFWLFMGIFLIAYMLFSWVGNCFKTLNTPTLVPVSSK